MTLRAAMIGAGARARVHLSEIDRLQADGKLVLTSVVDPDVGAARKVAQPRRARTFADTETMLESGEPDVVYVSVPYHLHPGLLPRLLDHGVHLFVEKPLAVRPEDTAALLERIDDAAERGVVVGVGYHRRYSRAIQHCRELLLQYPPAMIVGHWYWGLPVTRWARDFALSGGQLFAQLSHQIDLARHLGGEVDTIYACAANNARTTPADADAGFDNVDVHSVTATFTSGMIGNFHCTYALFPGIAGADEVRVISRELLIQVELDHLGVTRADEEGAAHGTRLDTGDDHLARMHEAFVGAATASRPDQLLSPGADAAMTSFVCAAANESARRGEPVRIREFVQEHTTRAEVAST